MNWFFIICIAIFGGFISYDGSIDFFSDRVYLSSLAIQVFSLIQIFNDKYKNFSLYKIFFLFTYFFLGIAPIIQFHKKGSYFGAPLITEEWYFYTNILIILICVFYKFIYNFFIKFTQIDNINLSKFKSPDKLSTYKGVVLIFLSIISFLSVLYINNFSVISMLVRGGEFKRELDSDATTMNILVGQFLIPISFLCFLFYITTNKRNMLITIVLFLLAVITCSPFGIPRFYAAAIYLPLLLIISDFLRRKNVFSGTIIFGLLFIFPTLDYFRYFDDLSKVKFGLDFKMFDSGHFDSYQNFSLILSHSEITWGYQLLGVIFFWIPRSIWESKPEGSGSYLAKQLNFSFDNISANFFAEGYINFGVLGILIFIIIISYATAFADKVYWIKLHKADNFLKIAYFILLGMLFFMLRGDLLSSFAFTVGFMLSFYTILKFLKI